MEAYSKERVGLLSLQGRKPRSWERAQEQCVRKGISNIRELSEKQMDKPFPPHLCDYFLGEHFLLSLYETLGGEATSAALRELYLLYRSEGRPVIEEEIYQAFLRHTPPELIDALHEVYDRLHGGPYADWAPS